MQERQKAALRFVQVGLLGACFSISCKKDDGLGDASMGGAAGSINALETGGTTGGTDGEPNGSGREIADGGSGWSTGGTGSAGGAMGGTGGDDCEDIGHGFTTCDQFPDGSGGTAPIECVDIGEGQNKCGTIIVPGDSCSIVPSSTKLDRFIVGRDGCHGSIDGELLIEDITDLWLDEGVKVEFWGCGSHNFWRDLDQCE